MTLSHGRWWVGGGRGLSISVSTGDNKYGVKYLQHGQLRLGLRRDVMAVYKPTLTCLLAIQASQVNIGLCKTSLTI